MKTTLGIITALLLALTGGCGKSSQLGKDQITITPSEAVKLIHEDKSVVLLDVRTSEEFRSETGHLNGAILIPVQELEARLNELEPFKEKTIIAYCRSGNRSGRAEKILTEHGFKALNLTGGMNQWNKENLPVVKEPK
jgi:rhodanese-related sulfurtransferase